MDIGNKISQKIRLAIKAKLVDLGAYVDDELPDYIMVMVANKKTRDQMTEDLNLFLGVQTEEFTGWLHQLLIKLQSITTEDNLPENSEQTEGSDQQKDQSEMSVTPATPATPATPPPPEHVEPDIIIKPVMDDFAEEEAIMGSMQTATDMKNKETSQPPATAKREESTVYSSPPKSRREETKSIPIQKQSADELSRRKHEDVRRQMASRTTSRNMPAMDAHHLPERRTVSMAGRKRRVPSSAVGAVVTHDVYDEHDGYDPLNPSVGNVASVVKVTERKSSVPPFLQANKSLVLRAVQDAHTSIEKYSRTVAAKYQSARMDSPSAKKTKSSVKKRLGQQPIHHSTPVSQTQRIPPLRLQQGKAFKPLPDIERKVQVFSRSKREDIMRQLRSGPSVTDQASVTSEEVEEEEEEEEKSVDEGNEEEEEEKEYIDMVERGETRVVEEKENDEGENKVTYLSSGVMVQEDDKHEIVHSEPSSSTGSGEYELDISVDDQFIRQGEGDQRYKPHQDMNYDAMRKVQQKQRDSAPSPKFVVTLDGVNSRLLEEKANMNEDDDVEMEETEASLTKFEVNQPNVGRVQPLQQRQTPMMQIRPMNRNISRTEDEGEDDSMSYIEGEENEGKPSRSAERCRFWPSCKNGDQCPFHHPTTKCRFFPQCQFGDKCMNIHPNCKFDANCTRPSCPFTHATKKQTTAPVPIVVQPIRVPIYPVMPSSHSFLPAQGADVTASQSKPPGQVKCRFFPKCSNMNCPYLHPQPCRYGYSCRNLANCNYTHPKLPSKKQLSWTPAASQINPIAGREKFTLSVSPT